MKFRFSFILLLSLLVLISMAACNSQTSEPASDEAEETSSSATSENNGEEMELPKTITIATSPSGSSYHAVGSGLAKVITENTPMRSLVQPSAGPNSWMSEMNAGSLNFGLLASHDAGWGYASGPGYDTPSENFRLVLAGNTSFNIGFVTREDTGITKLSELKGKRVATDYGGNKSLAETTNAYLESVGLTMDDIKPVPVPDFATGLKLLQDGSVDAAQGGSPTTAPLLEVESAVGNVIPLPFGDLTPEQFENEDVSEYVELMGNALPGVVLGVEKGGVGVLDEDAVLSQGLITMGASAQTSEEAVYTVLKAIHENYEELSKIHPWLEQWKLETMVIDNPPAPYHEGAIKFYKEMDLWTDENQQKNDELLGK